MQGSSRCLDAFIVALNETCHEGKCITSTTALQLASLQFCVACRSASPVRLRIDTDTPRYLWAKDSGPQARRSAMIRRASRVPALHTSENVAWPSSLLQLSCGYEFNQPVDNVTWPKSLMQLTFGNWFNRPLSLVNWPASLQQVALGDHFDQPLHGVSWPPDLRVLSFGILFIQRIDAVAWPTSLQELAFGWSFNHSVDVAKWPAILQNLSFGGGFNKGLDRMVWPASLQSSSPAAASTTFGQHFDQARNRVKVAVIATTAHPRGELQSRSPRGGNQGLLAVVWPVALKKLVLGGRFNQPIAGVRWPPFLQFHIPNHAR
ncbi:unnamed protein product [Ectocarpus sp. CCAP 1310/34]|nr:unnamed protein product [Ectocarpus sp. CCAP 1310/34]